MMGRVHLLIYAYLLLDWTIADDDATTTSCASTAVVTFFPTQEHLGIRATIVEQKK